MATHGLPGWPWAGTDPAALPPAEALLLAAMRAWGEAERRGTDRTMALLPACAAAEACPAIPALATLLRAAVPLALGCPQCPRLQPAEARLMLAVALAQRGRHAEAQGLLLRLLPPRAAQAALPAATGLGQRLRGCGLLLANPLRGGGLGRPSARAAGAPRPAG